jgi:hypothetical protein
MPRFGITQFEERAWSAYDPPDVNEDGLAVRKTIFAKTDLLDALGCKLQPLVEAQKFMSILEEE